MCVHVYGAGKISDCSKFGGLPSVACAGTYQCVGLTSSGRMLDRAVGSVAKAASCLQRYYCIFKYVYAQNLNKLVVQQICNKSNQ